MMARAIDPSDPIVGAGEMAARMRAFDWASTPLGTVEAWPQSLRSALSIVTGSAFPIAIYWGPRFVLLYNDAWSPILGSKHPWALGRPAREVWPELWDMIESRYEHVMSTGESSYIEDELLPMHRHGYTEECYFNYTLTGIRGEGGRVEGLFNAVVETTYRVIGARRTQRLQRLGERLGAVRSAGDACRIAADVLTEDGTDAPFCLIYLVGDAGDAATRCAVSGLPHGSTAAPEVLPVDDVGAVAWPLGKVMTGTQVVTVPRLGDRFRERLHGGPWSEPVDTALLVPLLTGLGERPAGVLVVGASPRRAIDAEYREFVTRAASHVATAISTARAYEAERARAEALAAIDRAKTTFFSNVSHEFRTPLTLMLGPTEGALGAPGGALTGEALETVYRNELRLLKLVNALLDFSRIEAGRMRAAFEPTDLAALTAYARSSDRVRALSAGFQAHLAKPAEPAELVALVASLAGHTLREPRP